MRKLAGVELEEDPQHKKDGVPRVGLSIKRETEE
jgi:hypothetical protein